MTEQEAPKTKRQQKTSQKQAANKGEKHPLATAESQAAEVAPLAKSAKKRKGRGPSRERAKKQFTVRVDANLAEAAFARATSEGLRLTDAVEAGLWLYVKQERSSELVMRGRFLWNMIPSEMKKATMGFWGYISKRRPASIEEMLRKLILDTTMSFEAQPECQQNLQELASQPDPDPGSKAELAA